MRSWEGHRSWLHTSHHAVSSHFLQNEGWIFSLSCLGGLAIMSFFASLVAQLVKNPPATQEASVQSLGREDPLEKGTATHSSILAWRIPWTIYGVTKSWTRLTDFHYLYCLHLQLWIVSQFKTVLSSSLLNLLQLSLKFFFFVGWLV